MMRKSQPDAPMLSSDPIGTHPGTGLLLVSRLQDLSPPTERRSYSASHAYCNPRRTFCRSGALSPELRKSTVAECARRNGRAHGSSVGDTPLV